jgi:hypothetical protein
MKSLMHDSALADALESETYAQPSLVPVCSWLDSTHPARPIVSVRDNDSGKATLSFHSAGGDSIFTWLIQTKSAGKWRSEVIPGKSANHALANPRPDIICVTAVDRGGNTSPVASFELKK